MGIRSKRRLQHPSERVFSHRFDGPRHRTRFHQSTRRSCVASTADLSLGPDTSDGVSLPPGSSAGHYWLQIDPPGANDSGILLSSVTQNGRGGNFASASAYSDGGVPLRHYIAVYQSTSAFTVDDINVAFAFFPLARFAGGFANNAVNNGPITALTASPGINLGVEFVEEGSGVYTLDVTGLPALGGSSQVGILLVNGAKDEDNYALSRANADGTFTIFNHDNYVNDAVYEPDALSFVYLPLDHGSPQIPAMGRIYVDGASLVRAGEFTVTSGGDGTFTLSIPGHADATGTLIISPEGGSGGNVDNLWS